MRYLLHSVCALALLGCPPGNNGDSPGETGAATQGGDSGDEWVDADGDGFSSPEDCDDTNAQVHPGATEICNELDDDCDGQVDEEGAVGQTTWFLDGDEDGYGTSAESQEACDAPEGYVSNASDCQDAIPSVNPGATEVCGDGVDNDCTGSIDDLDADGDGDVDELCGGDDCDDSNSAVHPGAVDTCFDATPDLDCDSSTPNCSIESGAITFSGSSSGDRVGYSVSGAGDFNGDGLDDLVIGSLPSGTTGFAYLVLGTGSPMAIALPGSPAVAFSGQKSGVEAGYSVAGVGDVDGDGFDDLLVGAPKEDAAVSNEGAAFLVLGSASPIDMALSSTTAAQFTGEAKDDNAGRSVAAAGDVNADGFADFLVGSWYNDNGGQEAGAAYLVLGTSTPGDATLTESPGAIAAFTGEAAGDQGGVRLGGGGDTDGDGLDDFLVGANLNDGAGSGLTDAGAAYLILGNTAIAGAPLSSSSAKFSGAAPGDEAGCSVAILGDVDGDGYADMGIGAKYDDEGGVDAGAVFVVLGSLGPASMDLTSATAEKYIGVGAGDRAGFSLAGAGDVDGDGFEDFLIGAPDESTVVTDSGAAYLIFGSAAPTGGALSSGATRYGGTSGGDLAGYSIAGVGDVDGDARDDFLVGAQLGDAVSGSGNDEGTAYLILGADW